MHLTCRAYLGAYKVDVESFQVQDIIENMQATADALKVDITKVQLLTSLHAHADMNASSHLLAIVIYCMFCESLLLMPWLLLSSGEQHSPGAKRRPASAVWILS